MSRICKPLVVAILIVSFVGLVPSCSYSQDNSQLTMQYNALVQEYNSLLKQHNELTQQYNNLAQQNNSYREEMERFSSELEQARSQLQNALDGAIVPPYITMNGRKANFAYRTLDNKVEYWSLDVETLESNTLAGTFMRNLSISDLNRLGLSTLSQRFINGNKNVNLGGKFTRIDLRPYIIKENFQAPASSFYSRHTDDESRIREVWNMVTQLCPYVGELKETPRLSLETLLFGGGDCEDVAILTASILKAMSSSWTVELVYMDSDSPASYKTINHVSVFVDTGTYKTFIESTQNVNMSPYQSVDGFYVEIP